MTEDYDVFSVEKVEDDVFQTGEIVESLAYNDGDGVREVYLDGVDERDAELTYSVLEFGHRQSELDSVRVGVSNASDAEEIVEKLLNGGDSVDELMVDGAENLETETAEAYQW